MGKTVFVPLTDDLLYEYPERISGPVIPFSQRDRAAKVKPVPVGWNVASLRKKVKLEKGGAKRCGLITTPQRSDPEGGAGY
jgi:hypothetical protein